MATAAFEDNWGVVDARNALIIRHDVRFNDDFAGLLKRIGGR
jgi:hypothetical protein